jgi:hypothetical protein
MQKLRVRIRMFLQPCVNILSGVCGSGNAAAFPTRCWFNNDPQGRYVCCDGQGCDGFNSDNLTPHCKNYGYVPPNFGAGGSTTPPSGPPSGGSQGMEHPSHETFCRDVFCALGFLDFH